MPTANRSADSTLRLPHLALARYLPEDLVMSAASDDGWSGRRRLLDPWLCFWGLVAFLMESDPFIMQQPVREEEMRCWGRTSIMSEAGVRPLRQRRSTADELGRCNLEATH
jgi:hypothetical protein